MKTNRAFLAQIEGLRQERIVKLQRFFLRGIDAHLSAEDMLELQYLIRDEYSIRLGIDALMGATENTGAYRHQIDMAQQMIEKLEENSGIINGQKEAFSIFVDSNGNPVGYKTEKVEA